MAANRTGSILAADFGSVYTRVVLLDVVDGVYHLVTQGEARTTVGYPFDDVGVGLDRILGQISENTGRRFIGGNGKLITPEQPDRSGVDYFIATASTGRPMKTVLVGLMPDMSIASGIRAASGSYMYIAEVLSVDDGRSEEERLNAILLSRPDLVFITGGTESGAQDAVLALVKVVRLALTLIDAQHRPVVVYAGNNRLAEQMEALFADVATLFVAQNVHPDLDEEELESAQYQLGRAFDEFKEHHGKGFRAISPMSQVGILPTAQSYALIVDYLGKIHQNANVLAVDVGSGVSTLNVSLDGHVTSGIHTEFGLGHSAYSTLQAVGLDTIRRWLPFNAPAVEIVNYAMNKTLRPATIPATLRDLYLEHALLRASIQEMVSIMRPQWRAPDPVFRHIIGAGSGLTRTGSKGYTAMLMLDALQPVGITTLYADAFTLIPALGAMALVKPEAVVQMLDGHGIERLGTCITVSGDLKPGKPALQARFFIEGEVFDHEIEAGHLWVLPLGAGKTIEMELAVAGRGLHIGGQKKLRLTIEGGTAGVIFDARGRPLPLAADARGRAAQLPLWVAEVTGDPIKEIDERWLEELPRDSADVMEVAAAPSGRKPRRRSLFGRRQKETRAETRLPEPDDDDLFDMDDDDFSDLLDDKIKQQDDELRGLRDELSS